LERAPTGSEFEADLQPLREEGKRLAGMSHMSSGCRGGARVNLDSPSSRVSNVGENRDLHKRMLGLEESIKLIMAALKIGNVGSTQTVSDNIARVETLDIRGVETLNNAKEDIEGVEDISTAPSNTGGVENTEIAQEKIGGFDNSETLVLTIGAVQGDSNVRNFS
jgi:hypothetical protein